MIFLLLFFVDIIFICIFLFSYCPGNFFSGYGPACYSVMRRFEYIMIRGTQRIVSVNYLFERPLIPSDFLKGIFTWNFRDMGNLRPSSFRIDKNVDSRTEKRSAKIFGKEIRPKLGFREMDKNALVISKRLKFP